MDTPLRCTARPDPGGSTRGVSAERFETPLVGGAAWFWRRGGNPPAPACPRRGKRERGGFKFLAAAGHYHRGYPLKSPSAAHSHKSSQPLESRNSQRSEERRVGKECRSRWS